MLRFFQQREGIGRCFTQIENIKRQSLFMPSKMELTSLSDEVGFVGKVS